MAVITAALLGGTILGSTFLATAAAAALNLALGIGVELAITSLMPKPEQPKFSIQGKLQAGDDTPRTVPVGYTATAGSLVYGNTWGGGDNTKNAYFTQVIALADVPISGLAGMWVGEQKITLPDMSGTAPTDQGWPITEYNGKNGRDHLWVKFYDGTQTTADSFLVNSVSTADRPYTSTRVGRGVAYAIVTARVAENLFTGLPTFRFELNGAKLYDITKDGSTGGTGLHRWDDPSTWGGDGDNLPAVQAYNILRGIRYGSMWLYGAQDMPEARLPRAAWRAAIDACRAAVDIGDDETEAAYRSGSEIRVSTAAVDALKILQDACLGHLAEVGGVYTLHVGEPDAPAFTITDDDIITTEEQIFTPFFGLADTVNGITAKYPSPADAWNSKTAPPLFSADFEAEDGNRRLISDLSLDAVPYDAQVQRIMKAALAEARRSRRHTFVLPPKYWRYAVPNVVFSYTSDRNGYTTKSFRIDGVGDKANLDNTVNVTEVDPTDFAWDHSTDFTPVSEGSLGSPVIPAQPITGWNAAPVIVKDNDGNNRAPGILVTFDGGLDDVQFVRVQVRLPGETSLQFDGTVPYGDLTTDGSTKSVTISFASIKPNVAYEVRGIFLAYSGAEMLWSNETIVDGEIVEGDWLGVTTDDIRLGPADLYPIDATGLAEDLQDKIAQIDANKSDIADQAAALAQEATDRAAAIASERDDRLTDASAQAGYLRDLTETMQRTGLQLSDHMLTAARESVSVRNEIVVSYENSTAYADDQINVAVGPNSAVAQRFSNIEASIDGVDDNLSAAVSTLQEAIADGDAGEASARQALEVQLRGAYTGDDVTLVTEGLLYQSRQGWISATQSLSQAIDLVSAGIGVMFDWLDLWSFDDDVDGWSGNGTPTTVLGALRPANDDTDPYVVSPTGLGITANAYRQVKTYLRKYGSPTWEGYVWYKRTGDSTWDSSRRASLVEQTYDPDGRAVCTWDMEWDGTIDQIRVDFSTAQTDTDYFTVDWVSIGRPSPGASQAQIGDVQTALSSAIIAEATDRKTLSTMLVGQADPTGLTLPTLTQGLVYDESQARSTGDAANASLIEGIQAELDDPDTGLDALASAQSAMQTDITDLDDRVTTNASNIDDAVASLADKASTSTTDALSAEIDAMGGGTSISQIAQAVRSLQLTAERLAVGHSDLYLGGQLQRIDLSTATANVQQYLSGRIDKTENSVTLVGQRVDTIELELPGLASLDLVSALTGRVTATEDSIESIGESLTSIDNSLNDKVNASVLEDYYTKTAADDATNTAIASALVAVNASIGEVSADGLISITANASPPDGVLSQIDFAARAEAGGVVATAAESLQVYDDDGTLRTRKIVMVDQYLVTDGTDNAQPMTFVDGVLTLKAGRIEDLKAGLIEGLSGHMKVDLDNDRILVADDS